MRIRRNLLGTLALLTAGASLLVFGTSAAAATLPPAPFTYCPVNYTNHGKPLSSCFASISTGGSFQMGNVSVSIPPGTVLQGGFATDRKTHQFYFVPASPKSRTLYSPGLPVPGGLLGVTQIQDLIPGVTSVTAEVRLVGPVTASVLNLFLRVSPGITLPVEVKLINPALGPNCTIGTPAAPILLNLTTGATSPPPPAQPISGTLGTPISFNNGSLFKGARVVDNTWGVPGATGCGPLGLLDGVVNLKSGLPSAPGKNVAILDANVYMVSAADVFTSGPYPYPLP